MSKPCGYGPETSARYASHRRPDPRIGSLIECALEPAQVILNVGAGQGAYEPVSLDVVAVEPSPDMAARRGPDSAPVVRAVAEALPFADDSFDATLGILTVHHWADQAAGLAELVRVARDRVVLLTWDPDAGDGLWLHDYWPGIEHLDRALFEPTEVTAARLGGAEIDVVPVPADCTDGFLGAYWRRPHAYLDPGVRAAISTFSMLDEAEESEGTRRLARDLETGEWERRHGALLPDGEMDLGYRLVVARL